MSPYVTLLIVVAMIVIPIWLGNVLARQFRMPDHGWKIGLVLFALISGSVLTYTGWPPKLGIDLSGGVILVYQVDQSQGKENVEVEKLIAAVSKRVNPGGVREVTIRPYGENQIEIIIPEVDAEEIKRIERKISSIGSLEFRIVANRRDHDAIINQAREVRGRDVRSADGKVLARWVPVDPNEADSFAGDPDVATRPGGKEGTFEVLLVLDEYNVTGEYLSRVNPTADQAGRPAVSFHFDSRGAQLFGQLTSANLPDKVQGFHRKLAIMLDELVVSAPRINSAIYDSGIIEGSFTEDRVNNYVGVLNAGSLPAQLEKEPISRLTTGPTLGRDMILKGERATLISMIATVIFMLIYYRFSGIMACFALVLNLILLLASMIVIKGAFTLPGLAGMVLTIGMAVDANVLIYERMREELQRGAALRMAIRNGFDRAFSAIFDSNLTTLITAAVLYVIGTDQVKGFAVTLFLGIAISMFTAIFCVRVLFEIAERRGWIRELKMMQMVGETNIDFVKIAPACIVISLVVIGVGLAAVAARAARGDLLDIDFTGGVSVQLLFDDKQPQDIAEVRKKVSDALPDVAVSDVQVSGEASGTRYLINTSERDLPKVEGKLKELFGDKLVYNRMTVESAAAIEGTLKSVEPAQESQSRTNPADDNLVASAGSVNDLLLATLALGQDAAAETPAETAPAAPAADAPATPAATDAAPAATPTASDAAPAAAVETTPTAQPETPAKAGPLTTEPGATAADSANVFAGGAKAMLAFSQPITPGALQDRLELVLGKAEIGLTPADGSDYSSEPRDRWELKVADKLDVVQPALAKLAESMGQEPFFPASTMIGGAVADNTKLLALYAMLLSILFMIAYIWVRFERLVFGVAATIALIHDVLVTLGAVALSIFLAPALGPVLMIDPLKINLPLIAAFLTIVGYSINDTIVTFDRLREIRGKSPNLTPAMVNQAINQTLARTLLTSLTVMLVVFILYLFGGQGIHGFAYAMIVGCFAGVYSTVFIATPIVLWMMKKGAAPASVRQAAAPSGAPPRVA